MSTQAPPSDTAVSVPALQIENLVAGYEQSQVLHAVSLTIPASSVVALVGPNGAGKSTLLKTISGVIRPYSGSVSFFGTEISKLTPNRRSRQGLCHIPEGHAIYRQLTVRENLLMQSRRGEERDTVDRAVAAFPRLGERMKQQAGTLSGGEQQMLAMVRAYIDGQRLILVDEPSLGLAPLLVEEVFAFLERIRSERDAAVLIVDQFVDRVLEMAQFAYVMRRGEIIASGTADEMRKTDIFSHYVDGARG